METEPNPRTRSVARPTVVPISRLIRNRKVAAAFKRAERLGGKAFTVTAPRATSQYELYPLPFFAAKDHSVWAVQPTGNYGEDCKTGETYAIGFLKSCDGTIGWSTLLSQISREMIVAGQLNGIVTGFMGAIGKALMTLPMLPHNRPASE